MEIKQGIDNLANRENKVFPPNAMEFKDLCAGSDYENALNAIMCRLQIGQVYEWNDLIGFNIWATNASTFLNTPFDRIPKLVKSGIARIDRDNLNPLPDYQVKQLEEQENYISYSEWLKTQENNKNE
jgi:CRISPR/Cas system CMR-associated protein Cmr3 (group 5 of RAMP superfamily)